MRIFSFFTEYGKKSPFLLNYNVLKIQHAVKRTDSRPENFSKKIESDKTVFLFYTYY